MKQLALSLLALLALSTLPAWGADEKEAGFVQLFNGKDLTGWKVTQEHPETFSVQDGAIVAHGQRAHCFYVGDQGPWKDFELKIDVMTRPGSNGGVYFHTKYQPEGWPRHGFEVQVNNSFKADPRRTGSLYAVDDVSEAKNPAKDNEWFTEHVLVKGNNVKIWVNDTLVVDYTEPAGKKPGADFTHKLDQGTFALQGHDPGSTVYYKNIRAKKLD